MPTYLTDSNIVLDIMTHDPTWYEWSSETLCRVAESNMLAINPVIYSEVSIRFDRIEDLEAALPTQSFARLPIPWEAAFLAGKCFVKYRKLGGTRKSPLPDFYIGAHAAVSGLTLITRDAARYRTYFPKLKLICPAL